MTLRDELVRAAVWAFPVDGSREEQTAAARRIVDVHRLAPLLEAEPALERARAVVDVDTVARRDLLGRLVDAVETLQQAEADYQARMRDAALALLRETSALVSPRTAVAA